MPGRLFDGWLCPSTLQARFEAIEPQSERRQRQPEAVQFFRARVVPVIHGERPVRLTLLDAPARYRENSAYTPRRLREQPFSALSGLARLSRHTQECETRFQLSSSTCASLRGALPWRRQGLPSSIQLARADKLLLLGSWLPPWVGPSSKSRHFEDATTKSYPAAVSHCS